MTGTYGINLVQFEVFFRISGDAVKSLQHLFESNSSALTLKTVSRRFSCILFLVFVLTEDTRKNILSATALLTEAIKQVRTKVASSLNALCWSTPIEKSSLSTGSPSLNGASSFQLTKHFCLYCCSILLTFPAWCIKGNLENTGLENIT